MQVQVRVQDLSGAGFSLAHLFLYEMEKIPQGAQIKNH